MEGLGANKSEKSIKRVAKAMGVLTKATNSFDCEVGIVSTSGKHSEKSQLKDLKTIIQQLVECDPFKSGAQRPLRSFPNLQRNVFKTLDEKKSERMDGGKIFNYISTCYGLIKLSSRLR